jgi:hypothetical protein
MLARMSSWNLNMTRCRVVTGVFRQPGKAVLAASTAALNSSAVVSGIRDTTSCVACDNPHTSTVDRSKFDQPEIKKKYWEGSRAHGVGDVDVLVGARLDELPADEEAHPRLGRRKARSGTRCRAQHAQSDRSREPTGGRGGAAGTYRGGGGAVGEPRCGGGGGG